MRKVIGLVGTAGSGKSTVSEALKTHHGFLIEPFAKPLKEMLLALGVPYASLYGTTAEKEAPLAAFSGRSGRELAQTLGTEWGRALEYDFWVNVWKARIERTNYDVVADDVRFLNEAAVIRDLGGEIWKIERPGTRTAHSTHPSETELHSIKPDLVLRNEYSKRDLESFVVDLIYNTDVARLKGI